MSYFGGFKGDGTFSTPIVTPAGYAFAIWGVITLGCLVYGIYQLFPNQKNNKLFDQLSDPLIITFTGFSLWIYVATKSWLWATVVVFVLMLLSLWKAYSFISKSKQRLSKFEDVLLNGTFGLYIGWATVAVIINIATALNYYHYIYSDTKSLAVYIIVLLVALTSSLFGLKRIHYNFYYFSTILWAFTAVAVRTSEQGSVVLTMTSLLAIVAVVAVWLKNKTRLSKKNGD